MMKSLGQNPTDAELKEMILEVRVEIQFILWRTKTNTDTNLKSILMKLFFSSNITNLVFLKVDEDGSGSIEFPEFLVSC